MFSTTQHGNIKHAVSLPGSSGATRSCKPSSYQDLNGILKVQKHVKIEEKSLVTPQFFLNVLFSL